MIDEAKNTTVCLIKENINIMKEAKYMKKIRLFASLLVMFFLLILFNSECLALKSMVPETSKEAIIEKYLKNRVLDPIEGIWYLPDENGKYLEVIIMKNVSTEHHKEWAYAGILTDSLNGFGKVGEAKMLFNKTATPNIFKGLYVAQYRMSLAGPKGQYEIKTDFEMVRNNIIQAKLPRFGYKELSTILRVDNFTASSSGIGFFITNDLVATNAHIVENKTKISVTYGKQSVPATVVAVDDAKDIAILKASGMEQVVVPLPLANPKKAIVGEEVSLFGLRADEGTISGRKGNASNPTALFQVGIPVHAGNSGGPLFNMNGQVIGIASSNLADLYSIKEDGKLTQNMSYAINISYLMDISPVSLTYSKASESMEQLSNGEIKNRALKAVVYIEAEK